jgi:hypothetical protein
MAMKSLSTKLQNRPVLLGPILIFTHWVLTPTVIGWPQLSMARRPAPVTVQASMAIFDRPRPVGESNRLEK